MLLSRNSGRKDTYFSRISKHSATFFCRKLFDETVIKQLETDT